MLTFRQAVAKAHNAGAEGYIRRYLTPIIRGVDAETKYLFWRNEYYPKPPEMSMIWNIRRFPQPLVMTK